MQTVRFIGEEETIPGRILSIEEVPAEEHITDQAEIKAMVRRAVLYHWQDSVFTYKELHQLLLNNGAVLPKSRTERNAWLQETIDEIWHTQKELARTAMQPLPTRLSGAADGWYDDGIVTPVASFEAPVREPEVAPEHPVVVPTPEVEPAPKPLFTELKRHEVARLIVNVFLSQQGAPGAIESRSIHDTLAAIYEDASSKEIRTTLTQMNELGYLETYTTGKGKKARTWLRMDDETRDNIIEEIEAGTLQDGLAYSFSE